MLCYELPWRLCYLVPNLVHSQHLRSVWVYKLSVLCFSLSSILLRHQNKTHTSKDSSMMKLGYPKPHSRSVLIQSVYFLIIYYRGSTTSFLHTVNRTNRHKPRWTGTVCFKNRDRNSITVTEKARVFSLRFVFVNRNRDKRYWHLVKNQD